MAHKAGFEEGDKLTVDEVRKLTKALILYHVDPLEMQELVDAMPERSQEEGVNPATVDEFVAAIEQRRAAREAAISAPGNEKPRDDSPTEAADPGEGSGSPGGESKDTTSDLAPKEGGPGIPTVEARQAAYNGTQGETLEKSIVRVENPDLKEHVLGTHTVDLIGAIDGVPIKRISNVPVSVVLRKQRPSDKWGPYVEVQYKLLQGVSFTHHVPNVPTFHLEKGRIIRMKVRPKTAQPKSTKSVVVK